MRGVELVRRHHTLYIEVQTIVSHRNKWDSDRYGRLATGRYPGRAVEGVEIRAAFYYYQGEEEELVNLPHLSAILERDKWRTKPGTRRTTGIQVESRSGRHTWKKRTKEMAEASGAERFQGAK